MAARFFLRNVTAGVFAGDRYDVTLRVEPRARVALGPTSATKVHAVPRLPGAVDAEPAQAGRAARGARSRIRLEVLPGGALEYDAGLTILQADASLQQDVELVVHPGGELVYRELIALGRLARGELLAFEHYATDLRVVSPDGGVRYRERATLRPATDRATLDAAVGGDGVVGTLVILGDPERALERAHAIADRTPDAAYAGASRLPNGCGAIVRVLAAGVEGALIL